MIGSNAVVSFGGDGDCFMPLCGRGDSGCSIYAEYTNNTYVTDGGNSGGAFSMTSPMTFDGKFV